MILFLSAILLSYLFRSLTAKNFYISFFFELFHFWNFYMSYHFVINFYLSVNFSISEYFLTICNNPSAFSSCFFSSATILRIFLICAFSSNCSSSYFSDSFKNRSSDKFPKIFYSNTFSHNVSSSLSLANILLSVSKFFFWAA